MMTGAIEILIERMKTHPEEFYRSSRWCNLVNDFDRFLTPEDKKAFENGVAECRRTELTEIVLDRLTTETKEDKEAIDKIVRPVDSAGNPVNSQLAQMQYHQQLHLQQLQHAHSHSAIGSGAQNISSANGTQGMGFGLESLKGFFK
jgi:hypothetical protein